MLLSAESDWQTTSSSSERIGFYINYKNARIRAIDYLLDPPKESNEYPLNYENIIDIHSSRFAKYCHRFYSIDIIPGKDDRNQVTNELLHALDIVVSSVQDYLRTIETEERNLLSQGENEDHLDHEKYYPQALDIRNNNQMIPFLEETFEKALVNEKENLMLAWGAMVLQDNVRFLGESSSGKTECARVIKDCLPKIDILEIGYSDPAALKHTLINALERSKPYKYLFLQEDTALGEHEQVSRRLLSKDDNGITFNISIKGSTESDRFADSKQYKIPPCAICTTSTHFEIDLQDSNREWTLNPDETKEQTEAIINYKIWKRNFPSQVEERNQELENIFGIIRALVRQIISEDYLVVNPLLSLDLISLPMNELRIRRDSERFFNFIELITKINASLRPKLTLGNKDYILSTIADFEIAKEFVYESFKISSSGLDSTSKQILEILEEMIKMDPRENVNCWFRHADIAFEYNKVKDPKSQDWVYRRLKEVLYPKGFVFRDKERNAIVWRLADKTPNELKFKENYLEIAKELLENYLESLPDKTRKQLESDPNYHKLLLPHSQTENRDIEKETFSNPLSAKETDKKPLLLGDLEVRDNPNTPNNDDSSRITRSDSDSILSEEKKPTKNRISEKTEGDNSFSDISDSESGLRKGLDKRFWRYQLHIFIEKFRTTNFEKLTERFHPPLTLEEIKFLVNELVGEGELLLDKDLISIPIENIGEEKRK